MPRGIPKSRSAVSNAIANIAKGAQKAVQNGKKKSAAKKATKEKQKNEIAKFNRRLNKLEDLEGAQQEDIQYLKQKMIDAGVEFTTFGNIKNTPENKSKMAYLDTILPKEGDYDQYLQEIKEQRQYIADHIANAEKQAGLHRIKRRQQDAWEELLEFYYEDKDADAGSRIMSYSLQEAYLTKQDETGEDDIGMEIKNRVSEIAREYRKGNASVEDLRIALEEIKELAGIEEEE